MKIIDLAKTPECIQQLAEWHHTEWSYLNPGGTVEKRVEKMQTYLNNQLIPKMFVCKDNDTLLGSAAIVVSDMDTRATLSPWLASVYVEKNNRNRGIGSTLVKHVINYAQAAKFSDLYLFTPSQKNFYESIGWSAISNELYRGQEVTVMQLKLKS